MCRKYRCHDLEMDEEVVRKVSLSMLLNHLRHRHRLLVATSQTLVTMTKIMTVAMSTNQLESSSHQAPSEGQDLELDQQLNLALICQSEHVAR